MKPTNRWVRSFLEIVEAARAVLKRFDRTRKTLFADLLFKPASARIDGPAVAQARFEVVVFIVAAGPNVFVENLRQTIFSIAENIGIQDFGFYFQVDKASTARAVEVLFRDHPLLGQQLIAIELTRKSWPAGFNSFFAEFCSKARYILACHDDIIVRTPDFFPRTLAGLAGKRDRIGWITYTNRRYYDYDGIPLSNSVREGFALDRTNTNLFECHSLPKSRLSRSDLIKIDLPNKPVRCHAPFSHMMLISSDALVDIGPCADWNKYTHLIDEDWGLRALEKNYVNVWIPDVHYVHPNPFNSYKRVRDLRFGKLSHTEFTKKWGFSAEYTEQDIEFVKKRYVGTQLLWSVGRNTFQWDYVE